VWSTNALPRTVKIFGFFFKKKFSGFFFTLFVPLSPLSSTVLCPCQNYFFFLKKRKPQCPKNEETTEMLSRQVGDVPVLTKDYHTSVAELETNDLLKVR
jgi:hypothetical protein